MEVQINVPENGESGTHKYIRHEKIDISHQVASVRIGSAYGIALLASAVRNPLQFFSAQWRFSTALCCDACAFVQVGLLLFPPHCTAL